MDSNIYRQTGPIKLRNSGKRGLTKPTFIAWYQTLTAVADCSKYLISNCGFYYVMTGNFQSDPIDRRFGIYRQSHGGNYLISIRQLFETERKILPLRLRYS